MLLVLIYHASLSKAKYENILKNHHFEVITYNIEDKKCGDSTICLAKYGVNNG